jgi:flagellar hook-length control protein FliK
MATGLAIADQVSDTRRPAVPQVASEAATHAFKPAMPNPARAAPSSERAYGSPFDSLIDDGTQGPASHPPQSPPASADKTAAQPDSAQPPAKIDGAKAAQAKGDSKAANVPDAANATDAGSAPEADTPVTNGKVPSDGKVKVYINICEQAAAEDDSKPAADSKPADSLAPASVVADPATIPNQTITPAAALATAPVMPAAPSEIPQAETTALMPAAAAALAQTVAATQPAMVAAGTPKAKAVDPAKSQDDSGKPADDPKLSAKAAFDLQSNGKPQSTTGDADKPAAAHPRDEAQATAHHASVESPPPIATDAQAAASTTLSDLAQPASLTPPSQDVSAAPATPTAPASPATPPAAVPLAGVAIQIASMAQAGKNHFEIRLDPPELGRIEVRLDVDRDGHVTSRLIADRSDTLDLLRRDASGLERALQDAGLKTADNGLQFSLRDQTMGREQSHMPAPAIAQIVVKDSALPALDATQLNYSRLAGLRGGIDIRV